MAEDRPRQPAYAIFSIKPGPSRFKEACTCRCLKRGTLLKSGYLSAVVLSSVKMIADKHKHAAYHNKH